MCLPRPSSFPVPFLSWNDGRVISFCIAMHYMIYDTKQICRKLLNFGESGKAEWRQRWRESEVVMVFTRQQWFSNNFFRFFLHFHTQKKNMKSDATRDGEPKRRRNGIFTSDTFGRNETSFNTYTKVCWHINTPKHNKLILCVLWHCA